MKNYISTAQAGKMLGVTKETIYNYCNRGILGGIVYKVGKNRAWKVDKASVELLLKEGKFQSTLQLKKELQGSLF